MSCPIWHNPLISAKAGFNLSGWLSSAGEFNPHPLFRLHSLRQQQIFFFFCAHTHTRCFAGWLAAEAVCWWCWLLEMSLDTRTHLSLVISHLNMIDGSYCWTTMCWNIISTVWTCSIYEMCPEITVKIWGYINTWLETLHGQTCQLSPITSGVIVWHNDTSIITISLNDVGILRWNYNLLMCHKRNQTKILRPRWHLEMVHP